MPKKAEKRKRYTPQPPRAEQSETTGEEESKRTNEYKRILIANCKDDSKRKGVSNAIYGIGSLAIDLNSPDFVSAATHVVAFNLSCNEKILGAVASGVWLVRADWVTKSWRLKEWQAEDEFLFDSREQLLSDEAKLVVTAWRRNFNRRRNGEPKVFSPPPFKSVAVVGADCTNDRRIVECSRRVLFAGGGQCRRGVTAARIHHPAVYNSLTSVFVVDGNCLKTPVLEAVTIATLLSVGIPTLPCSDIKTICLHDIPRDQQSLLNRSIAYWTARFKSIDGNPLCPISHKFILRQKKGDSKMSVVAVIDLDDSSGSENSPTIGRKNEVVDLMSSSGSSVRATRSRSSTIDLISNSSSSRHSSVPLRKGKSDGGGKSVELLSTASSSSNEDIRVIELPGAGGDDMDEKSKNDLYLPVQPFTPLIRRLSSLELKGADQSVKQEDVKSSRIFIGDEGLNWLLEKEDDTECDLSWFALHGNIVALCENLKKNEAQKGKQCQNGRSVDHFESLMSEVASASSSDEPSLLSLDAVNFLRTSLCSSSGAFKPTRNVLRRVFNQIAMAEKPKVASDAAFNFLRAVLRYWPPGSHAMRMHWLLVMTEIDFYATGNSAEQMRLLIEHFHAKFGLLIENMENCRLSVIQLVFLVELFELDLANHVTITDQCTANSKLDAIPFVLYAIVGLSPSSGAFYTEHLERIFTIAALMSRTEDATVRQLCGRLLAVCFEAQRLVQTGKEHLADIESVPIDLRRNLEDLAAKFVNDFAVKHATFAFHLPSQWLQQIICEQMSIHLGVPSISVSKLTSRKLNKCSYSKM